MSDWKKKKWVIACRIFSFASIAYRGSYMILVATGYAREGCILRNLASGSIQSIIWDNFCFIIYFETFVVTTQQSSRSLFLVQMETIPVETLKRVTHWPRIFFRECLFQLAQVWSAKLRVSDQSQGKEKGWHHMTNLKKNMKHITKNTNTISTIISFFVNFTISLKMISSYLFVH